MRNGKNPFLPDKNHIHHKLLALGMSERWTMVSLIGGEFVMIVFNILMSRVMNVNVLILIDAVVWIGANILLLRRIPSARGE